MGANDGIVSIASLLIGVASAGSSTGAILLAGVAGTVAGAMSMAAGEYVSVSSQADIEAADLAIERNSLKESSEEELRELAAIYEGRGLEPQLALQVARQMTAHDALAAHARDEIGIVDSGRAQPIRAALSSGATFTVGAALPLAVAALVPQEQAVAGIAGSALVALLVLGLVSAQAGGAPKFRAALRVVFWGGLAMVLTFAVGSLFGVSVA